MGKMTCPRCDSVISTVSSPSDHTGYYVSDRNLEVLEGIIDRARAHVLPDWLYQNCPSANHCPYCGYIWEYENDLQPTSGYILDETKKIRKEYRPPPLFKLECETPNCEDRGGYIRRSQVEIDMAGGINNLICELCGQPYVLKEEIKR